VIANLSEARCLSAATDPGGKKAGSRTAGDSGGRGNVREMGRMRGVWDRVAFYAWSASYLTSLWTGTANKPDARPDAYAAGTGGGPTPSSPSRGISGGGGGGAGQAGSVDPAACWPALALSSLPALIEYDAAAALAVLCAHTTAQVVNETPPPTFTPTLF
jgi:hypothetical protein